MSDNRLMAYVDDGIVTDEHGRELLPTDDDYYACESELESMCNPLSDDYCKYDFD